MVLMEEDWKIVITLLVLFFSTPEMLARRTRAKSASGAPSDPLTLRINPPIGRLYTNTSARSNISTPPVLLISDVTSPGKMVELCGAKPLLRITRKHTNVNTCQKDGPK